MNARLSQEIDSLKDAMQTQINWANISANNDKVLPEMMNTMGNQPLIPNGTGMDTYTTGLGIGIA